MLKVRILKLIFAVSILFTIGVNAQKINFRHFTSEQGLSQNFISCILQDTKGFMWFGTKDGLNRYDGYEFKVYRHDAFDTTSLSGNWIYSIFEDSKERLWVGTNSLNLFIIKNEKFKRINLNGTNLKFDKINAITEDVTGLIWIGTDNGLISYNPQSEKSHSYFLPQDKNSNLSDNMINSLGTDDSLLFIGTQNGMKLLNLSSLKEGRFELLNILLPDADNLINSQRTIICYLKTSSDIIYAGTTAGLIKINLTTRKLEFIPYSGYKFFPVWQNRILSLVKDQNGNLWIGCSGGLVIYNPRTNKFDYHFYNPQDESSLSMNSITALFADKGGKIWVGTAGKGLNIYDQNHKSFLLYKGFIDREPFESSFSISAILLDSGNQLWVSSQQKLFKINRTDNHYSHIDLKYGTNGEISSIVEDKMKNVWVGSSGGLYKISYTDGSIKYFHHNPIDKNSLKNNNVKYLFIDNGNFLYVLNANYLSRYDDKSDSFVHYKLNLDIDKNSELLIRSIYDSGDGSFWIGWLGGLVRYNLETGEKKIFNYQTGKSSGISNNAVLSICADPVMPKKYLWIGTQGGGLNRLNLEDETFTNFTDKSGLPNNFVYGILSSGNELWLSTNNGLCRVTTDKYGTPTFRNFDVTDGLQGNEFNTNAYCKGSNGELFFGGLNGVNGFFPSEIRDNIYVPPVVFTDLTFLSGAAMDGKPDKLKISLVDNSHTLVIPYSENSFTVRFTALDFTAPEKNKYMYRLEPVQKNWIELGTDRNVTFNELGFGDYKLHVIGSNNDGIWNREGAILKISVTPPFWSTNWAYLVYFILITFILLGIRKYELNRMNLKNRLRLQHFETQKLREVDEMKSEFFANISHEFRTPLTLILGPAEQLDLEETDKIKKQKLNSIKKSAATLLKLINQILDLSKVETGKVKLKYEKNDLVGFIKGITMSFISIAERKNITLSFIDEVKFIYTLFDKDVIEKIFNNLLSNAIKFTPAGGSVTVRIAVAPLIEKNKSETYFCNISVEDSGIGISESVLPKVFDKFFTVAKVNRLSEHGSGIGLALVKELVELHQGKITVQSELNKGSIFTAALPVDNDFVYKNEFSAESADSKKLNESSDLAIDKDLIAENLSSDQTEMKSIGIEQDDDSLIVLIIEDNIDVRNYISNYLNTNYKLITASDGKEGFEKAIEVIPDLIISDVMMPEMDGFTLCKKLKADERTSHIPIIILTAKAGETDKLNGLEFGADDYLIKPFSSRELVLRVKNLIEIRTTLRKKFSDSLVIKPKEITTNSIDKVFLEKAVSIVEKNINNEKFTAIDFSNEMNLSHSQLHRKLKALVNQSIIQFVRSIRMQRADELLRNNAGTISEIAYMVGFSDPGYFTRTFSKHFGYLPSEIKN